MIHTELKRKEIYTQETNKITGEQNDISLQIY